ncbi:translation initiation factor IF-2 N-terminal domain-containing protein, partial [Bacillus sp. JJ1521]|uniref:translation initiation factor IF-2 N-terminal domain-containing protein n=1 Tax=Bacillus sp. JJ1521 TaxID=3122957 RepID=UPI0030006A3E
MSRMRVYEYAKKQNISSKEVITKLKEMDIEVKNHMATIEGDILKKLDQTLGKNSEQVKPATEQNKNSKPKPTTNDNKEVVAKQETKKNPVQPKNRDGKKTENVGQKKGFQSNNNRNNKNNKNKQRGNNRQHPNQHQPVQPKPEKKLPEKITFIGSLTVGELAGKLGKEPSEIIKKLFMLGVMATINQELDKDSIELIASEYGVAVEEEIVFEVTEFEQYVEEDKEEDLIERPSIVTI